MKKYLLSQDGCFYKANLHTHTNITDGDLSPEEVKALYKSHGYSVVAYTDHDMMIPHHDLSDESFLALTGFEVAFNEGNLYPGKIESKCCHLCMIAPSPDTKEQPCWNPKYAYLGHAKEHHGEVCFDKSKPFFERDYTHESVNEMIRKCREAGFFVTYNHPTWSFEDFRQYSGYEGMHAMEIYNHDAEVYGYPSYVPQIYDDLLRLGKRLYPVAADDNHNRFPDGHPKCDSCGGFVVIKARELAYRPIMDSLFRGDFYASTGPLIHELYMEDGQVHIKCSPAMQISFSMDRRRFLSAFGEKNEPITEASFAVDPNAVYFRITVRDEHGKHANTRAYFLDELN